MAQDRSTRSGSDTPVVHEDVWSSDRSDAAEESPARDAAEEVTPFAGELEGLASAVASRLDSVLVTDHAAADAPTAAPDAPVEELPERAAPAESDPSVGPDVQVAEDVRRIGFDTEYELAVQRLAGVDPDVLVKGAATIRPRGPTAREATGEVAPDVPEVVRIERGATKTDGPGQGRDSTAEAAGRPLPTDSRRRIRWIAAGLLLLAAGAAASLLIM